MCTNCNKIKKQIKKLPFNNRPNCSRKNCIKKASYQVNNANYYCTEHIEKQKIFREYINIIMVGCILNRPTQTKNSFVGGKL